MRTHPLWDRAASTTTSKRSLARRLAEIRADNEHEENKKKMLDEDEREEVKIAAKQASVKALGEMARVSTQAASTRYRAVNEASPRAPAVILVPGFLSRERADALLERIRAESGFRQNYIQLFGGKPIPRLEAWYGSWDYPYSKGIVLKAAPMPDYLQDVIREIGAAGLGEFNAVLINRYRDGKDYISPHSDDDYGDPEPTITSLTLGATRPFRLAKIISGSMLDKSTTVEYLPAHGDLLIMRGRTNSEWQHWVPRTVRPIGERINLTFRMRQA
jgi:alkylated DNA repair dioxygenase AlkB